MRRFRIDYYKRSNLISYKEIDAIDTNEAIKKSKVKSIVEIMDITGKTYNRELRQYI